MIVCPATRVIDMQSLPLTDAHRGEVHDVINNHLAELNGSCDVQLVQFSDDDVCFAVECRLMFAPPIIYVLSNDVDQIDSIAQYCGLEAYGLDVKGEFDIPDYETQFISRNKLSDHNAEVLKATFKV